MNEMTFLSSRFGDLEAWRPSKLEERWDWTLYVCFFGFVVLGGCIVKRRVHLLALIPFGADLLPMGGHPFLASS